jgi:NADH-quinone oxidoreductase subunit A
MEYQLLNVLVFAVVGILFVTVTIGVVGRLLRPRLRSRAEPAKEETYECGEPALGTSRVRFDIRFYTVALVFLVFDVEVMFLYPWALVFKPFREAGVGLAVLLEVLLFVGILGVGFAYCWAKRDLDWVKGTPRVGFPPERLPAKSAGALSAAVGQGGGTERAS